MQDFRLPDLGDGLSTARIAQWHSSEGDQVDIDDLLLTIETHKSMVDIPSPISGKLVKTCFAEGQSVSVGDVIARFDDIRQSHLPQSSTAEADTKPSTAYKILPQALKLLQAHDIDPQQIQGSGKNGMITQADVRRHLAGEQQIAQPCAYQQKLQQAQQIPLAAVFDDALIHAWYPQSAITPEVIQSVWSTLQQYKSWFQPSSGEAMRIGLAIERSGVLHAPALDSEDMASTEQIKTALNDIKAQAEDGRFKQQRLKNQVIILSNIGMFGGKYAQAMILPPAICTLAIGAAYQAPVWTEGHYRPQWMLPLSLTFDHRHLQGRQAAMFLSHLVKQLSTVKD